MSKSICLVLTSLLVFGKLSAQIAEKYYGTAGRSELVLNAKVTFDKGTIAVGYSFDPATSSNTDGLIYRTDSAGNILWAAQRATSNADKYYAVIQTHDSNFVAVGILNATSMYNGNVAVITKFSATGVLMWEKQFKNTTPGEVLYDVLEMPLTHHIVAAGSYDFTPGANSGMLIDLFYNSGNVNWIKTYDYTGSNQFNSMTCINNTIYVVGMYQGLTYYDGYLVSVSETNGNVNWANSYEFNSTFFPSDNCNWFVQLQGYNNQLYIGNYITNDYVNSQSQMYAVLRTDTSGQNPLCLEMRKPATTYANDSYFYMYNNRLYTVLHPANNSYSPLYNSGLGTYTEAVVSKMANMNAVPNPLMNSKRAGNPGDQGIYSLNASQGMILCSGLSVNDPVQPGAIDIFNLTTDTSFLSVGSCVLTDTSLEFGSPQGIAISAFNFTNVSAVSFTNAPITVIQNNVLLQTVNICYDPLIQDTLLAGFSWQIPDPCDSALVTFTDTSLALHCTITNWHWNFGDGDTSLLQHPQHHYSGGGTYTVTLIVTSNTGKTDTAVLTLSIHANQFALSATANPDSICAGTSTVLSATGALTYQWSGGIQNNIPFVPSGSATYTVTGTNAVGCTQSTTVYVYVANDVLIQLTPVDPVLCAGDSLTLHASGATQYHWMPETAMNDAWIPDPLVYPSGTTTYTVTGTDGSGCSGTASITLTVVQDPHLVVTKSGDVECGQHQILLQANGASSYQWMPASLCTTPAASQTWVTITQDTMVYVNGQLGTCELEDSIQIHVYNDDEATVFIPNVFSPNGDGHNDCLHVKNQAHFLHFYFTIYNRWGQQVYESDQPDACWDGNFKNQPCESDTYYYYLKAETRCGKWMKKGDIILLR